MHHHLAQLTADAAFCQSALALWATLPATPQPVAQPLDELFSQIQYFARIRRREARLARLEKANRAIIAEWRSNRQYIPAAIHAFNTALLLLAEQASVLQPLLTPALDNVIALAATESHPLRQLLQLNAIALGFTLEEVEWLFGELNAIKYRPVALVCADDFDNLRALIAGVSVGETGLLLAGFARFTGKAAIDERLTKVILRLRERGATASIFLVLLIIFVAHLVAAQLQQSAHVATVPRP